MIRAALSWLADRVCVEPWLYAAIYLILAGCAVPETRLEPVEVRIPIPVACQVPLPEEPRWALDRVPAEANIDQLMAAALAEILQRAGYELQLRAALAACTQEVPRGKDDRP